MKIKILRAAPENAEQIEQLEQECFSRPWSLKSVQELILNPDARVFVAMRRKKTVGYAGMMAAGDEGYITNVAVTADLRKRGIGKLLVSALAAQAREERMRFITLEMRQSNLPAAALYTACGFEPRGLRRGYYDNPTEDAVILTRDFDY